MNKAERFNKITEVIDQLAEQGIYKEKDIAREAFRRAESEYLLEKIGDSLFKFVTSPECLTTIKYIKRRQMMAAYKSIINKPEDEQGFAKEIAIADVGDQAKFTNAFKKTFGMTPTQARKLKDESLYKEHITWEDAGKSKAAVNPDMYGITPEQSLFGEWLNRENDKKIQHAEYLQRTYDLNLKESQFAYGLAEQSKYTVDECFEYVYDYIYKYVGQVLFDEAMPDRDVNLEIDLGDKSVQYMYFECQFGFSMMQNALLASMTGKLRHPIKQYNPNELAAILVGVYKENDCPQELIDYFNDNDDGGYTHYDFCQYLYLVIRGRCKEELAFSLLTRKNIYNYDMDLLYLESCRLLKKMATIYSEEDVIMYYTPPEWYEDVNELSEYDQDPYMDAYERREQDYLGHCPYENWEYYNWENYCDYEDGTVQRIPANEIPEIKEDSRYLTVGRIGHGLFENVKAYADKQKKSNMNDSSRNK